MNPAVTDINAIGPKILTFPASDVMKNNPGFGTHALKQAGQISCPTMLHQTTFAVISNPVQMIIALNVIKLELLWDRK